MTSLQLVITRDFFRGCWGDGATSRDVLSNKILLVTRMESNYNELMRMKEAADAFRDKFMNGIHLKQEYSDSWKKAKDAIMNSHEEEIFISDHIKHYWQKFVNFLKEIANKLLKALSLSEDKHLTISQTTLEKKSYSTKWKNFVQEYENRVRSELQVS